MASRIADGIYRIEVPLPYWATGVNLYLLDDNDGPVLVDCGTNTEETFAALNKELESIGAALGDISRILVTHSHHDHYGMVGRLRGLTGASVAMHSAESTRATQLYGGAEAEGTGIRELLLGHGLPDTHALEAEEGMLAWRNLVCPTTVEDHLTDGQRLFIDSREYEVLCTPGHSAGHLCLYQPEERLLIAGDHVSAESVPHVGVTLFTGRNPLRQYLDSLGRVADLEVDLMLPGHGGCFAGHRPRIEELIAHYAERTETVWETLGGGRATAYDVAQRAFGGDSSTFEGRLIFTETIAHLELLASEGKIERKREGPVTVYHGGEG
jgi:glyoxylase-like metal-dependent hydrolase (beta-lactamase superfamily II)